MDALVNQLARELSEAIAAAVSADTRVDACREKARAAGFELRVSLEAAVGFVARDGAGATRGVARSAAAMRAPLDMSATDRRFLKSLRIAADDATEGQKELD